jgi:hypothetical protein
VAGLPARVLDVFEGGEQWASQRDGPRARGVNLAQDRRNEVAAAAPRERVSFQVSGRRLSAMARFGAARRRIFRGSPRANLA